MSELEGWRYVNLYRITLSGVRPGHTPADSGHDAYAHGMVFLVSEDSVEEALAALRKIKEAEGFTYLTFDSVTKDQASLILTDTVVDRVNKHNKPGDVQ